MSPRQRPAAKRHINRRHDCAGFRHTTRTELTTGHLAVIRADNPDPIARQTRQIALRGGVLPHPHIHRRRDQHPFVGGQQQGRGQIIRHARRHSGDQIRRCRGHDHQIGRADAGEPDRAAVRWSLNGRHTGFGVYGAPTGAPVHIMGFTHAEFGPWGLRREFSLWDPVSVWKQILLAFPDHTYQG